MRTVPVMAGTKPPQALRPKNYTVELEWELQERVKKAMQVRGAKVFNDFGRLALIALCRQTEQDLKRDNPEEYQKIYGG